MLAPRAVTQARSMAFSSSRMLPGQVCVKSFSIASGEIVRAASPRRAYLAVKCVAKSGMSSGRSRNGGNSIFTTFRR